jgi:hypothetical protein
MLGPILVSVHNIRFYQRFMADLRRAIGGGTFTQFLAGDPRCRLGPSGNGDGASDRDHTSDTGIDTVAAEDNAAP